MKKQGGCRKVVKSVHNCSFVVSKLPKIEKNKNRGNIPSCQDKLLSVRIDTTCAGDMKVCRTNASLNILTQDQILLLGL